MATNPGVSEGDGAAVSSIGTVLVAVVGLTPQVVTETVWCLKQMGEELPKKIVVLTTQAGKLRLGLLPVNLRTLYEPLPPPELVEVVTAGYDLTLPAYVTEYRDKLVGQVVDVIKQADVRLHLSIGGGRNSQVSVATQVMQLLGRADDVMSQVLLDPPEVELAEDFAFFWYPASPSGRVFRYQPFDRVTGKYGRLIDIPREEQGKRIEIKLNLVEIPFLPVDGDGLIMQVDEGHRVKVLEAFQRGLCLSASVDAKCLVLQGDDGGLKVLIGPKGAVVTGFAPDLTIALEPLQLAVLWWIVWESTLSRDKCPEVDDLGSSLPTCGGASWSKSPDECPETYARYWRLVAWLVHDKPLPSAESYVSTLLVPENKSDGSTTASEIRRICKAHHDRKSNSTSLELGPGQNLSHLRNSLRPLGPLASYLLDRDEKDKGSCRVHPKVDLHGFSFE